MYLYIYLCYIFIVFYTIYSYIYYIVFITYICTIYTIYLSYTFMFWLYYAFIYPCIIYMLHFILHMLYIYDTCNNKWKEFIVPNTMSLILFGNTQVNFLLTDRIFPPSRPFPDQILLSIFS